VLVLLAIAAAVFVLPSPWGVVAVVAAVLVDLAEIAVAVWYTRRRRPRTGVEALPGSVGRVVVACRPLGQVRLEGELWQARSDPPADRGAEVEVLAVEPGLLLAVRPVAPDGL